MSNQIVITSGAKVRSLEGVITGSAGVLGSVPLGAANGVATLDSGGKVPVSQLPSSVVTYLGTWNAATNTPTLVNGVGDAGDMYICNVAGTVNFGAGPVTFAVGDWVLYGSGTWQKSNGQNGTVTSVGASITGNAIGLTGSPITTAGTLAFAFSGTSGQYVNGAGNLTTFPTLITSIGLSMPSAFSVANSPLTANGSINVTGAGTVSQYIDGTGALQTFPALTGYVPYTGATTDVDLGTHVLNAQALHVKGTAGAGHLGLKHQTATPTGSANESLIFADVNGNLGWQNDNLYLTTLVSNANTANRSYTFPNASGTLALTSDISYPVTSVFGRTGAVTAQSGDYTTTLVTEGTRLYYTDARARAALSFTAGSGAYNSTTGVITIPTNNTQITNGAGYITLTSLSAGTGISYNNLTGVISSTITQYTDAMARAAISGGTGISYNSTTGVITNTITQYTDALARAAISLTTTGTSGAATYNSTTGVLNIPQYTDAYTGTVTSVAALTIGTSGTDLSSSVANSTTTPVITLNVPTASATNRGALSSADWTTFNNKQSALTNPVTGTGTTNYLPKFTGTSTIGNSIINEGSGVINIGTTASTTYGTLNVIQNSIASPNWVRGIQIVHPNGTGVTGGYISISNIGQKLGGIQVGDDAAVGNLVINPVGGNLGLGVTPSAWGGNARVFEGANGSALSSNVAAPETALMSNAFYNGSSWIYKTSSQAARYSVNGYNGSHTWEVAPSGTTGNAISFTQAMTLTASGRLLINTPTESTYQLDVNGTGRFSDNITLSKSDSRIIGGDSVGRLILSNSSTSTYIALYGASHASVPNVMAFVTNSATALTLASTGAATFSNNGFFGGGSSTIATGYGSVDVNGSTGGGTVYSAGTAWKGRVYANSSLMSIETNGALPIMFYPNGTLSLTLASTGAATFSSTIKTAGFGSTTARTWKLGELVTATVIGVNTTGYLTVEVNGSQYNLALANLA